MFILTENLRSLCIIRSDVNGSGGEACCCLDSTCMCWWQKFTHRMTLALLQHSLGQMVVEYQPPEYRQVEEWLQQDNKTRQSSQGQMGRLPAGSGTAWHCSGYHLRDMAICKIQYVPWSTQTVRHEEIRTCKCPASISHTCVSTCTTLIFKEETGEQGAKQGAKHYHKH